MVLAALVLILSTALFFFYFHAACGKILQRRFAQEYFRAIVSANRLEFPAVRKVAEDFDASVDYPRLRMMLKCDFLALSYLLKNAANVHQTYTREEYLLLIYFRLVSLTLGFRHLLRLQEKSAILKLTSILQFFANVVGQRVDTVRFGNLTASDYLLNL